MFDFDEAESEDRVRQAVEKAGYRGILYSTFSHGEKGIRFRFIAPLAKPYEFKGPEDIAAWKAAYKAVADRIGLPYDEACCNPIQMAYTRRIPENPKLPPVQYAITGEYIDAPTNAAADGPGLAAIAEKKELAYAAEPDQPENIEKVIWYLQNEAPPAIQGNSGTITAIKVAQQCVDLGLSPDRTVDLMEEHYNQRCQPPFPSSGTFSIEALVQRAVNVRGEPVGIRTKEQQDQAAAAEFSAVEPLEPHIDQHELRPTATEDETDGTSKEQPKLNLRDIIIPSRTLKATKYKPKEKIVDPWLREQQSALITSDRGIGKTQLGMSLALEVAKGGQLGNWKIYQPVRTLYLDGEMTVQDTQERLQYFDDDRPYLEELLIYSDCLAQDKGFPNARLDSPGWRKLMREYLLDEKIGLFVIDNIASLTSDSDENTTKDWSPINRWVLHLRNAGLSVVLMHHTNKAGGQRGTHSREDNIDTSIMLRKPPDYNVEDGARFIIEFTKHRVSYADLHKIQEQEFRLLFPDQGSAVWGVTNPRALRQLAVKQALEEDNRLPKKERRSNRQIAEECGCSDRYVRQIRNGLKASEEKIRKEFKS